MRDARYISTAPGISRKEKFFRVKIPFRSFSLPSALYRHNNDQLIDFLSGPLIEFSEGEKRKLSLCEAQ